MFRHFGEPSHLRLSVRMAWTSLDRKSTPPAEGPWVLAPTGMLVDVPAPTNQRRQLELELAELPRSRASHARDDSSRGGRPPSGGRARPSLAKLIRQHRLDGKIRLRPGAGPPLADERIHAAIAR